MEQQIRYFDSHCHLQEPEIVDELDQIMERWRHINGGTIVCCGTKEEDWQAVINIAIRHDSVLPCIGLHPWFIHGASHGWADILERHLDQCNNIGCIGEIGLDFLLKELDTDHQEKVFKTQITMARERGLPVSIHVRKAWDCFIRVLKRMGPLPEGGVIHSYSGSADMVELFERHGLYISFSGSVTNPHNKKVRKALTAVSLDRLLIETDSPAILPRNSTGYGPGKQRIQLSPELMNTLHNQALGGDRERTIHGLCRHDHGEVYLPSNWSETSSPLYLQGWNEPANIFMVALSVSEILQLELPHVIALTEKNGRRLFKRSVKHS